MKLTMELYICNGNVQQLNEDKSRFWKVRETTSCQYFKMRFSKCGCADLHAGVDVVGDAH